MVDSISRDRRSDNMRRIKSRNTKPEMIVRSLLHRAGYRYRLHDRSLPGSPDIVLRRRKKAIFVHGCFWHQHPGCRQAYRPKSRPEFWLPKLDRNRERDLQTQQALAELGWDILVIWECDTTDSATVDLALKDFLCDGSDKIVA